MILSIGDTVTLRPYAIAWAAAHTGHAAVDVAAMPATVASLDADGVPSVKIGKLPVFRVGLSGILAKV